MNDADDFLARADDVLADWAGSKDSATWRADGKHEHDPYSFSIITAPPLVPNAGRGMVNFGLLFGGPEMRFPGFMAMQSAEALDAPGPERVPVTVRAGRDMVHLDDAPPRVTFRVPHEGTWHASLFRASDDTWLMNMVWRSHRMRPDDTYTLTLPQGDLPVLRLILR